MAKRSKWSIQKTNMVPVAVRDSEFAEILARLGQLMYDELNSQPDSVKSKDLPSQQDCFEIASQNTKASCV